MGGIMAGLRRGATLALVGVMRSTACTSIGRVRSSAWVSAEPLSEKYRDYVVRSRMEGPLESLPKVPPLRRLPLAPATNVYEEGTRDSKDNATDRGGKRCPGRSRGNQDERPEGASRRRGQRSRQSLCWAGHIQPDGPAFGRARHARYRARKLLAAKAAGAPVDWTLESNALAMKNADDLEEFACFERTDSFPDETYIRTAKRLIPGQIELGGRRLADLLNAVLGSCREPNTCWLHGASSRRLFLRMRHVQPPLCRHPSLPAELRVARHPVG